MVELMIALLYMVLVVFFLTRDEAPTSSGPRAVDDDDTWP
jgi:hypothetical protein